MKTLENMKRLLLGCFISIVVRSMCMFTTSRYTGYPIQPDKEQRQRLTFDSLLDFVVLDNDETFWAAYETVKMIQEGDVALEDCSSSPG